MEPLPTTKSQQGRRALRDQLLATRDDFVTQIPKVEPHVHIEGTLMPELRWEIAKRNGLAVRLASDKKHPRELASLDEVQRAYAADLEELTGLVMRRGLDMTLCLWAYLRRWTYVEVADRLRVLKEAGVRVCVSSDSPAYMDDSWVLHNLLLAKRMGGMSDGDILAMMKTSIEMSWATDEDKTRLLDELASFGTRLS